MLADAGWDVCLLEAADIVGGAVRSAELHPGHVTDLYSAFYPLAAASPVIRSLELDRHGLRWSHAPVVLAHPMGQDGESAALLHRRAEDTAACLAERHPRDGETWMTLWWQWERIREPVLSAHPGGGTHGVCGYLAARAALGEHAVTGPVRRRLTSAALELVYRDRPSAR